jgi:hypothetical protein
MKRLSIPFLFALALFVNACERHSASSLPSHGGHAGGGEHAAAPGGDASKNEAPATPPKDVPAAPAPKFFEQQPGK